MSDTIPKTMKAFAIDRFGEPGSVRELPVPEIGPDDVLVRVRAAGVNPLDLKIRDGAKAVGDLPFPHILGQDAAGVVVRAGASVTSFREGSEVYGAFWLAGSFAEYVRVPALRATIAHKPAKADFTRAAGLPTPALAARAAIQGVSLGRGQTVLVNGATGGVGSYVVQMARQLRATVIATARPDGEAHVRKLGADEVIDYTRTDLVAAVRAAHPDGIDAVIDVVSNQETLPHIADVLHREGRLATTIHAADVAAFARRGLHAINVDVFGTRGSLDEIARLVDDENMTIPVERTFPLEAAADALAQVKAGHIRGKIVLTVS